MDVAVSEYAKAAYHRKQAIDEFLTSLSAEQRAAILRREIVAEDNYTALKILPDLKTEDLKSVFPALVGLLMPYNGLTYAALELIRLLPFEWVMNEMESAVLQQYATNKHSEEGDKGTAYMILINDTKAQGRHDDALKLARRAAASTDKDIRETGMEFL